MTAPILVVEDHDDSRELLVDFLDSHGYAVESAVNGLVAWERLMSDRAVPCLVLLDLTMPQLDGWQLRSRMRRDPRLAELPVIVLSAVDNAVLPEAVQGFVPKPVDLDLLIAIVRRYCGTR
ncbi:MAG: response regulator [Myxococcaceae bacterium]